MDADQRTMPAAITIMGGIIEAILPKPAPLGPSLLGRVEKRVNVYYNDCFPADACIELFRWVPRDSFIGHKFQKLRRHNHIRLFVQVDFELTRHGDTPEQEQHLVTRIVEAIDTHAAPYMVARPRADRDP